MAEPGDDLAELARVDAALNLRWPETHIDPSTERIQALVDVLGSPQHAYPVIHVAGTNGKTSTTRIIDALLRGFGLRVGRSISPHLRSVTERISVDGEPISAGRFVEVYDYIAPYVDLVDRSSPIPLSKFEVLTAMAFVAFSDAPVDVAVIEVGLGGGWDSTNVADGQIAVVTPIAMDHMALLGDTIGEIAAEKAGIIKPDSIAVLAAQDPAAGEVLIRRATEVGATVAREGLEFGVLERVVAVDGQLLRLQGLSAVYDEVFLPLFGAHQAQNAVVAVAAVEAFFGGGAGKAIDPDTVRAGLAAVSSPGRLERVRSSPTVLVDAAHNPHGMAATVAALTESFTFTRLIGVVSVLADKDVRGVLEALVPALDSIVITENSSPRRMPAHELAELAYELLGEERVVVYPELPDAIEAAVELAEAGDEVACSGVLVTGSVVTAGDARALLGAP